MTSFCLSVSLSLNLSLSLFLKVQPPEQGNTWSISPEGQTAEASLLTPVNLLSLFRFHAGSFGHDLKNPEGQQK